MIASIIPIASPVYWHHFQNTLAATDFPRRDKLINSVRWEASTSGSSLRMAGLLFGLQTYEYSVPLILK